MKLKTTIFTFIFLSISCLAFTQEILVSGIIHDENNLELPFASILFSSALDETKTFGALGEEDGSFAIKIPKDQYNVEVSVVGSKSKNIILDLEKTKRAQVSIRRRTRSHRG